MRSPLLAPGIALLALGCGLQGAVYPRGQLALVSSRALTQPIAVEYHPRVEGRSCMENLLVDTGKDAIALAVADALAKRPEANALALVRVRVADYCWIVEGTPVRLR